MHPDTMDAIATAAAGPDHTIGMPPRGFRAGVVTEPLTVDHTADEVAAQNLRAVVISDVATDLTMLRMLADGGNLTAERLDSALGRAARTLRALAAGAAVLALALVGVVAGVGGAPAAQAAEGPGAGDGVGVVTTVVPVTLNAQTVRVQVPVVTAAPGHCVSIWGPGEFGRAWVGGGCSRHTVFTVPVTLDARLVPLGRSYMAVVDDEDPLATYPQTIALDARRQSRFGVGTYTDRHDGALAVRIPVQHYSPAAGTWAPSQSSPVQIQESTRRGWRVRATLTTNRSGIAAGTVRLGAGLHVIRAVRPIGATVTATTGTVRYLTVTDCAAVDVD